MNEQELSKIIEQEKEAVRNNEIAEIKPVAPSVFNKPTEQPQPNGNDKATQLVESAFQAAIMHRVETDENVQSELLDSAGKVIENKLNAVKSRADLEDKETHFNNKKGACECFGYNETTTEKWAVNVMNVWHNIMTAIWLGLGFFTFAPVTFIAKKISVIFKKAWVAILVAFVIYLSVILIPLLTGLLVQK